MEKEELEALVGKALEEHPEVFPGSPQVVELLGGHGVRIRADTILKNLDVSAFQLNWIKSCSEKTFLENLIKGTFSSLDEKCKEAVKKRLGKIIKEELKCNQDIFPNANQISSILKSKYGFGPSDVLLNRTIDLYPLKLKWINESKAELFFGSYISYSIKGKKYKNAINGKFRKLVEKASEELPHIYPTKSSIRPLLKEKYGINLSGTALQNLINGLDITPIKLKWIKNCPDKIFLEQFEKRVFVASHKKVKDAVYKRFIRIVKKVLDDNHAVFPSLRGIEYLLREKYGTCPDSSFISRRKLDLAPFKLKFIKKCDDKIFLENISKNAFTNLDKKCREAADKRMHDILLSHIADLDNLQMDRNTINKYLQKFPDLAFISSATEEHRFTLDQRIVMAMHIWKETRNEHLHRLIGERLEQLWAFRELFALMKDGRCLDADVVSIFHEILPDKIRNYTQDASITHSFVDKLRDGSFEARAGKDVLLLSFMHWLTKKQTAEIMLRLNQSVGTDNNIYMTSPNGLEYADKIINSLNDFGFVPEKIGTLYLLPPGESEQHEQRKLLTKSKVLQFRKIRDIETAPDEAKLFSEEKKREGEIRPEPKSEIISYDEKTLKNSLPVITLKDIGVVFTEETPEVKQIKTAGDMAILELKGGAIVGFNMEPGHPYSIEVEGRTIPKGTDNAVLDIINGKEGFKVSDKLKSKYKDFMKLIKEKREEISGVKKTKLKGKR